MTKQVQVLRNPIADFIKKYGVHPKECMLKKNPIDLVNNPKTPLADCKKHIETSNMIGEAMKAMSEYNKAFQNMHIQLK